MRNRAVAGHRSKSFELSPWLAGVIALVVLGLVAWLHLETGQRATFTLMYLLPIAVATYFVGQRAGMLTCVAAAAVELAIGLHWPSSLATECWNTGGRLGVFVLFCTLLDRLHRQQASVPPARQVYRLLGLSLASAAVLAVLGWTVQRHWPSASSVLFPSADAEPKARLARLAVLTENALRASRPVLLGSRDATGPSCVTPVKSGDIHDKLPANPGDLDGGPGTTMATLYTYDRKANNSALKDFEWHQKRLRAYLENEAALNQPAAVQAHELAELARSFAEEVDGWSKVPADLAPIGYARRDNWPSYCLSALDHALATGELSGVKHWSGELASACFSLDDLHRWLRWCARTIWPRSRSRRIAKACSSGPTRRSSSTTRS